MLLILLNWALVVYVSFCIGFGVRKVLLGETNTPHIALTIFWGLCAISAVTTLSLFFVNAGWPLLLAFFAVAAFIHLRFRASIRQLIVEFAEKAVRTPQIIAGAVLLFCLLVFSAQPSKVNDDGFYYTQTVMWFTDTGLVHGISNLLLPLGLGSSWHILQALFSFDFLEGVRLNDLNGLLMLVFFVYVLENRRSKYGVLLTLLFAGAIILSVPFLSACAPDLPIIIFTAIGFHLCLSGITRSTLADILLLAAFAFTIKMSAIALVVLSIVVAVFGFRNKVVPPYRLLAFLLVVVVIALAKNIYQTGYPFYPYSFVGMNGLSWATPEDLLRMYTSGVKSWAIDNTTYFGTAKEWKDPSLVETIRSLLSVNGIRTAINAIVLCVFPIILILCLWDVLIVRRNRERLVPSLCIHLAFVLSFILWLKFAPQYRFILPLYLFYGAWFVSFILDRFPRRDFSRLADGVFYLPILVLFIVSVVGVSLHVSPTSTEIGTVDAVDRRYLLKPHTSYNFHGMDTLRVNDQKFYHVTGNSYCWDSPLPCMSEAYYQLLRKKGVDVVVLDDGGRLRFELVKI